MGVVLDLVKKILLDDLIEPNDPTKRYEQPIPQGAGGDYLMFLNIYVSPINCTHQTIRTAYSTRSRRRLPHVSEHLRFSNQLYTPNDTNSLFHKEQAEITSCF